MPLRWCDNFVGRLRNELPRFAILAYNSGHPTTNERFFQRIRHSSWPSPRIESVPAARKKRRKLRTDCGSELATIPTGFAMADRCDWVGLISPMIGKWSV